MATVTLSKLDKTYAPGKKDAFRAVKGIDLDIQDKEFMVLVGPSGCGKSTTLRMIAGLEEISGGTLRIGERVVNDVAPKSRGIAMVFQNYALYPHMSVFDNMAFGLKLQKMPRIEIKERVDKAAAILGLEELLDRKPKALSGGQRQRVAVGRAIVRQPDVFLFDEPLSNLDAKMRVQMRAEISRLHKRLDATMIYVTHDQVEAMTMGDRICVMRDGLIMQVADPLTLYNKPDNLFVAGFIGSPSMNFLHGRIEREGDRIYFVEQALTQTAKASARLSLEGSLAERARPYIDKPIILGIRPENIELAEQADTSTVAGSIEVAEPMGAETFLTLATGGGHLFSAKVHAEHVFKLAENVALRFDLAKALLFDPDTEQVLRA